MGEAYCVRRGGAAPLNYTLRAYAPGSAGPASNKNNDIWVSTDVKVPEHYISFYAPSDVLEGTVWIPINQSGNITFSITKKNPVVIPIKGCKQYISGKWVNKNAWIWASSGWVQFSKELQMFLYQSGEEDFDNNEITGGWSHSNGGRGTNTLTVTSSSFYFAHEATGEGWGYAFTNKYVDLTSIKKIIFEVSSVELSYYSNHVSDCIIGISGGSNRFVDGKSKSISSGGTYEIDVSDLSGEYYPLIYCKTYNSSDQYSRVTISSITMQD